MTDWRDLRVRVMSALVMVPVALVCVWLGGVWFVGLVAIGVAAMGWEWHRMSGGSPRMMAIGLVYIGPGALALLWLRGDGLVGLWNVAVVFGVVWASDIGAYLVGRLVGGAKLAPAISPGKTWSGAVGGLVAAGGAAYLPLLTAIGPFDSAIERLAAIDAGGALASRIAALREIAARVQGKARLTLDPSERHGFEYQTWFGFMIYADGVPGSLGRGGSYTISPSEEPAIGFSLYPDRLIDALAAAEPARDKLFLPLGHDPEHAARLRAIGWRTVAALSEGCDARALGCTHTLAASEAVKI